MRDKFGIIEKDGLSEQCKGCSRYADIFNPISKICSRAYIDRHSEKGDLDGV